MPPVSQSSPAPFASLSPASAQRQRWRISQLFTAPFRDVDDRAFRLAEAGKREREARQTAMSGAVEPRRG